MVPEKGKLLTGVRRGLLDSALNPFITGTEFLFDLES
jgi:hypothetical protein